MQMEIWPENYCDFYVHNRLDKPLRIYWGGDIWGGFQVQDIPPNSNSIVKSRNVRRAGADVVFRMNIRRVRNDGTEHHLVTANHAFTVPALWDCGATTIFLWGTAESLEFFSLNIRYYYGTYETRVFEHKLTSVYLGDWICEENCPQ